jgi:UPF0176 protein
MLDELMAWMAAQSHTSTIRPEPEGFEVSYSVAALYCFSMIEDPEGLKEILHSKCLELEIIGTLLLASEGINGTIAGRPEKLDDILEEIKKYFPNLRCQKSTATRRPFKRMLVKLKAEIVTMGVENIDPTRKVGEYVKPENWNALIQQEDVVLVDTRNDYEFQMGTFRGALDPKTASFREFPSWVDSNLQPSRHKKIAMFCTGGIRCEKATAYLLEQGFENVYHLDGGILNYLRRVPVEESTWSGDCFVFDERVSLGHGLIEVKRELCSTCTFPILDDLAVCSNCGADINPRGPSK